MNIIQEIKGEHYSGDKKGELFRRKEVSNLQEENVSNIQGIYEHYSRGKIKSCSWKRSQ